MAQETDNGKDKATPNVLEQAQQLERAVVAPDGTITIAHADAKLMSVDIADVDLLLSFSDGSFVIVPNGALDAISGSPPTVVFNDHKESLGDLFKKVGISNHAKAGSLRVVSGNVDAPKTMDETEEPRPLEKDQYNSESSTVADTSTAPAPLVKAGRSPVAGSSGTSGQSAEASDPVIPQNPPRTSTYSGSQSTPIKTVATPSVALTHDTGLYNNDKVTNDASLTISSAASGVVRTFTVDGAVASSYVAPNSEGSHTVVVTDTDSEGNSARGSLTFVLDRTPPAVPIVTLSVDSGSSSTDLITNNSLLSISAAASDIVTRTYSIDGGQARTNYTAPTTDGSHTVIITDSDLAGNSSSSSITFVLDRTVAAPVVTLAVDSGQSTGDKITNNANALVVTAAAEPVTREFSVDGGAWSASYVPPGSDGSHNVTVRDTDIAGNSAVGTLNFVLDTTAPLAPTVSLAVDSGSSNSDKISNISLLNVSGVEAGAVVEYSLNGVSGWSNSTPAMAEGSNTVFVRQTDIAGNVSVAASFTYILDTIAPAAPTVALVVDSGSSGSDKITNTANLSIGGIESGAIVEYSSNGLNGWNTSVPGASEGSNTVFVRQTDLAGNSSAATSFTYILDTVAPAAPTVALAVDNGLSSTDKITNVPALNIGGIENGAFVEYSSNGTVWSATAPLMAEGSNTVFVRQTDVAGNVSASSSLTYFLDTTAPVTPSVSLAVDSGANNSDKITNVATLSLGGIENGALVEYSTDGVSGWNSLVPGLSEGLNTVFVRQTDVAGNVSGSSSLTFALDHTIAAPTVALLVDSGLSSSDRITNNANSLSVSSPVEQVTREYSVDGGAWSSTYTAPATDGNHTVTVRDTDLAGNTASGTLNFLLDTAVPQAPQLSLVFDSGASASDKITNVPTVNIAGVETGALVEFSSNGTSWSSILPSPSEGANTLFVRQTDVAGNVSASSSLNFILDTTIVTPTVALTVDSGISSTDAITNNAALSVSTAASDVTRSYVIDGGQARATYTAPVADGIHTVVVTDTDVAGNSASSSITFTLDRTIAIPTVALTVDSGTSSTDLITNNAALSVSAAASDVTRSYYVDGGPARSTYTPPVADGSHTVIVTDTDIAGNSASNSITFTLDRTIVTPTIALSVDSGSSSTDLITNNAALTVSGAASDVSRTYSVDGGALAGGYILPTTDGNHTVVVTDTDVAGNSASSSITFTLDRTVAAPSVALATDSGISNSDLITNNGTLVISGVETGAVVEYSSTGSSGWSTTAPGHIEGSNTVYARQTDVAGNVSASTSITYHLDTQAPVAPVIINAADNVNPIQGAIGNGGATNDPTPTLTGTAEANSIVTIYDNSLQVSTVTADASGNWSYTPVALADGSSHSYIVTATDSAGNVSGYSAAYDIHIDTTPPSTPSITSITDNVSPLTGVIANGGYTNDQTPTLVGAAEAGSTVTIYDNGVVVTTLTADAAGSWNYTPAALGDSSAHSYTVTATDVVGNVSTPSAAYDIHIDVTAPAIPVISGVMDNVSPVQGVVGNGGYSNDPTPTLTGTAEINSTIALYDNGVFVTTLAADTAGNWNYTPSALTDGSSHSYTVTATDAAGNLSGYSSAYDVHIDTSVPAVPAILSITDNVDPVQGVVANGGYSNDSTPTLSGAAEAGSVVTLYDNAVSVATVSADAAGHWTYTPTALADGSTHSYTVTATDAAGNVSGYSAAYDVHIDVTAPVIPAIVTVTDNVNPLSGSVANGGFTNDTTPTLNGVAEPNSTVTLYDNSLFVTTVVTDSVGNWSYTPAPLADSSTHSYTVTSTDAAGNTSGFSNAYDIHVDTTPPAAPVINTIIDNVDPLQGPVTSGGYSNDTTPTLTGLAEANSTVTIFDNAIQVGTVAVNASKSWSYTSAALSDGSVHTFTAVATDAAGNASVPSASYDVHIDTTIVTPLITGVIDNYDPATGSVPPRVVANGGYTNDQTPTIVGSAEANSTVTIYDNSVLIATLAADASGNWSYTSAVLADGTNHSYTVMAVDTAGNNSLLSPPYDIHIDTVAPLPPAISVITDNVAPQQGIVASGGYSNDTTPTLVGIAEANSTITVYDNGSTTPVGTALADASGNWSYTTTALADGSVHSYTVTATDAAGNVSTSSTAYDIHIDTTAPAIPAISSITDNVDPVQGAVAHNGYTNDVTPTLVGTAEANTLVTIFDNSVQIGTTTADGSGSWSYTTTALADGSSHSYTITATDAAGNASVSSASYDIHIDTTAPTIPVITSITDDSDPQLGIVANHGYTNDVTPTLSGMAEAHSNVTIYDNGSTSPVGTAVADASGNWSYTPGGLVDGSTHSYTVTATDAAGNTSGYSSAYDVHIDTSAPAIPVISTVIDDVDPVKGNVSNSGYTNDPTPTLNGTAEANSIITVYDKAVVVGTATTDTTGNWSFTSTALADGSNHSFSATATDAAGNVSDNSAAYDLHIDTSIATPIISSIVDNFQRGAHVLDVVGTIPNGGYTNDQTPTLHGSAEANSIVTIFDNAVSVGTATVDSTGAWSYTPDHDLADGTHSYTVSATDVAGNNSSLSTVYDIHIDNTPPAAPLVTLTIDSFGQNEAHTITLGTAVDTITNNPGLTIGNDPGTIVEYSIDGSTGWSATSPIASEGYNKFYVRQIDQAGNISPKQFNDFTLDTTIAAPAISLLNDTSPDANNNDNYTKDYHLNIVSLAAESVIHEYNVDGSGWNSSYTEPTSQGVHTIVVRDTDQAGNQATSSLTYTLDTIAPSTPTVTLLHDTGISNSDGLTNDASLSIISDAVDNTHEYRINNGTWSRVYNAPTADGVYDVEVLDIDIAGNKGLPSNILHFTLDKTLPAAPVVSLKVDSTDGGAGNDTDHITNDARLLFGASAEPVTHEYSVDGATWSTNYNAPVLDGNHTVLVHDIDNAGNVSANTTLTFTLDTSTVQPIIASINDNVDPVRGVLTNGGYTNDLTPTLTGSAEAGSTVEVYDGVNLVGTTFTNASGVWSYNVTALTDGTTHSFTVSATDIAGNPSIVSAAYTINVDTTPPDAPTVSLTTDTFGQDENHTKSLGTAGDLITNTPGLTIGHEQYSVVEYSIDGTSGWSTTLPTAVEGPIQNKVYVRQIDQAGNISLSTFIAFTLDTSVAAPSLKLDTDSGIKGDNITNVGLVVPQGVSENVIYEYRIDGGAWTTFDPADPSSFHSPTIDKTYTIDVRDTDIAGNQNISSITYTLDTKAPAAPTVSLLHDNGISNSDGLTNDALLSIVSDAPDNSHEYRINGGTWSSIYNAPTADGTYDIEVRDVDVAGNIGAPSSALHFELDTTPPVAPVLFLNTDSTDGRPGHDSDRITNNANIKPPVPAEPFVLVEYSTDNSTFSNTYTAPNTEGSHIVTVRYTDRAGNHSETSLDFILDTTAPTVPIITGIFDNMDPYQGNILSGKSTNDQTPTISGTAEANSIVRLYDNGILLSTLNIDSSGTWNFTTGSLANGSNHSFDVTATDVAGNTSDHSASYDLRIDTYVQPPVITTAFDNVSPVVGNVTNGGYTNDPTPTISGTAEANSTVRVYDDSGAGIQLLTTLTADASGNWSFTTAALANGVTHTFTATASNGTGSVSDPSTAFVLHIDTSAPPPVILGIADDVNPLQGNVSSGGATNDITPTLSGTAEINSTVNIYDNGIKVDTAAVDGSGNWSYAAGPLSDGSTHSYTATATDIAGNISSSSSAYSIRIDTTAPVAPLITGANDDVLPVLGNIANNGHTNDTTPTLTGIAEANSVVTVFDGPAQVGTAIADAGGVWSFTPAVALLDGTSHSYTVTATDAAGNVGAASASYVINVDTFVTPPVITGVTDNSPSVTGNVVNGGYTDDTTPTIKGTADANTIVTLYDGSTSVYVTTADSSGNWSYTPGTLLLNGSTHTYTATETNATGNVSNPSTTYVVHIDTKATTPAITEIYDNVSVTVDGKNYDSPGNTPTGGYTNDSAPVISGLAEANSIVRLLDNGVQIATVTADNNGSWSYTPAPMANGSDHVFTIIATDLAGNVSNPSTPYVLHIDTTAPVTPTINTIADNIALVSGAIAIGGYTNDPTPTLSGVAEANSTVHIYDGSNLTPIASVTADSTGNWSYTTTSLSDGSYHNYTVDALDAAHNLSGTSTAYDIHVDTSAPATPVLVSVIDNVTPVTGNVISLNSTNDLTPVLNGTAEANSLVTIYDNNVQVTTLSANGSGNWSYAPTLADGSSHSFTFTATDVAGNVSATSTPYVLNIDNVAPAAPVISGAHDNILPLLQDVTNGAYTNDTTPTLFGTAEANSTVTIYEGASPLASVAADASGNWSYNTGTLVNGSTHDFTAIATDAAGNFSGSSSVFTISIDTTIAPPVITSVIDDVLPNIGDVMVSGSTNDSMPTFHGTAEVGSRIYLYDGSTLINTNAPVYADINGVWVLTPSSAFKSDSDYTLTITSIDAAGNSSSSAPLNLYIIPYVETPVIASIIDDVDVTRNGGSLLSGGFSNDKTLTFTGTVVSSNDVTTVTVYDNGVAVGTQNTTDGNWSITTAVLGDGAHSLSAVASIVTSTSATVSSSPTSNIAITVDTVAPIVPVVTDVQDNFTSMGTERIPPFDPVYIDHIASGGTTNDTKPEFIGTGDNSSTLFMYEGTTLLAANIPVTAGKWDYTLTNPLEDGIHTFTFEARDAAGNFSSSANYVINVNTAIPEAVISGLHDAVTPNTLDIQSGGYTNDPHAVFFGHTVPGSKIVLTNNGLSIGGYPNNTTSFMYSYQFDTDVVTGTGDWSFKPDFLADGTYTVKIKIYYPTGNQSAPTTFTFTVDTVAPTAAVISSITTNEGSNAGTITSNGNTIDRTPTLHGTAEANSIITIHDFDGTTTTDYSPSHVTGTTWDYTPVAPLAFGSTHTYTVSISDLAGNLGTVSNAYVINIFNAVPIPVVTVADHVADYYHPAASLLTPHVVVSTDYTDDSSPTFSGNNIALANGTIKIYNESTNGLIGSTSIGVDGSWQYTPAAPLADGTYNYYFVALNSDQNVSDHSSTFTFTVDTKDPVPIVMTLNTDSNHHIAGTLSESGIESGIQVEYKIDGGAWSSSVPTGISTGHHIINAHQVDHAGNESAVTQLEYYYETSGTVTGGAGGGNLVGGAGDDVLQGNGAVGTHEYFYGNAGNDTLNGGHGDNTFYGGTGSNTMNGGDGINKFVAGAGSDTIHGSSTSSSNILDYSTSADPVQAVFNNGTGTVNHGAMTDTYDNIQSLVGSGSNDTFTINVVNGATLPTSIDGGGHDSAVVADHSGNVMVLNNLINGSYDMKNIAAASTNIDTLDILGDGKGTTLTITALDIQHMVGNGTASQLYINADNGDALNISLGSADQSVTQTYVDDTHTNYTISSGATQLAVVHWHHV